MAGRERREGRSPRRRRQGGGRTTDASSSGIDDLAFHPVDASRWPDFVRLFESPGAPRYCWCMAWRGTLAEKKDAGSRKAAMEHRVRDGVPIGILGYAGGEPVAWCSIAPRETYRGLGGVEEPGDAPGNVWSVVCFFIKRTHRKQGMTRRLLDAAAAYAREQGATSLEAYPVDPDSPSYRFMGFVPFFEAAGFREVGRAGTRRHVMRLDLRRDQGRDEG